ncbi:hypothetical protein GOBAR_DD16576 [Gossypium barbadense]|nr:hypothetical protein GOBAR_DD16576 [Gossypium barbadense]
MLDLGALQVASFQPTASSKQPPQGLLHLLLCFQAKLSPSNFDLDEEKQRCRRRASFGEERAWWVWGFAEREWKRLPRHGQLLQRRRNCC